MDEVGNKSNPFLNLGVTCLQVVSLSTINGQNPFVCGFVLRNPPIRKMHEENVPFGYFLFVTVMIWIRIEVRTETYAG